MSAQTWGILIALILSAAPVCAQQVSSAPLVPFFGETAEEFEARVKGGGPPGPREAAGSGTEVIPADDRGHFVLQPAVGGRKLTMLVDTGASVVALSSEDARTVGITVAPNDFTVEIATANGAVKAAPVRVPHIQVGAISVRDVEAVVLPPGRLRISLLGMSFLKRLSNFQISQGQLTLRR